MVAALHVQDVTPFRVIDRPSALLTHPEQSQHALVTQMWAWRACVWLPAWVSAEALVLGASLWDNGWNTWVYLETHLEVLLKFLFWTQVLENIP